ncbi:MAG: GntR family transcriptional regulator [Oscillospiraceae bacterium]
MLDRLSSKPLHIQMEDIIRHNLVSGDWAPGQAIPSENEMSATFGISRTTVRNVITKLVHEDLLDRIPGKGTFVKGQKIVANPLSYAGIREQLEHMGHEVSTKLLSIQKGSVSPAVAKYFPSVTGGDFYCISRLRFIKGVPLSIHTSYIPASYSPDLNMEDLEHEQLCVILSKRYDLKPSRTVETLESVAAVKEEAQLLKVRTGSPLLSLKDEVMTEDGRVFEYTNVVFRGDKIQIHLSF